MRDILLITVDSLRHDHLSCYGYDRNTSPKIDDIADRSQKFLNCFSHAGTTRKSFPTILTSSYTSMYGGYERISEDRTLVSEVLKQGGYKTAAFHSNLFLCADFGYNRGFDTFYDSKTEPSLTARLRQTVKDNLNQDGFAYNLLKRLYDTTERKTGVDVGSMYTDADDITGKSLDWIEKMSNEESPRFLWTHYMDVHHPYVPPEEHQLEFRDEPIGERRAIQLRRKMLEKPDEFDDDEYEDLVDLYDAEIRYTDHEVGKLVDSVRKNWGDDTLTVITADHGEEFLEHGGFSHSNLYDETIHVPLIIDDKREGEEHEELVGLMDVSPTIVDYAGQEQPDNFYGHSLKGLIENGEWEREHIVGGWADGDIDSMTFMYRDDKWKYIKIDEEELYNLDEDPGEKENMMQEEPEVLGDIRTEFKKHRELVSRTSPEFETAEMEEAVEDRLRKLGYME